MVFSTDENSNKAVVCAGVPDKSDQFKQLDVIEWLTTALGPIKGKAGKGKVVSLRDRYRVLFSL